jgi:hypothetical protein
MKRHVYYFLSVLFVWTYATAADVCQETDEFGNVSYIDCSQAQSEDATPVEIQPVNTTEPTESAPASQHDRKPTKSATGLKNKDSASKYKKEVEAARKALEAAKEVREGDRQGTVTGSRLTEQYFDRVRAAEERLRRAEENLK